MEGIEKDREIVRNMKAFDRDSIKAAIIESLRDKKISYVKNLIAASCSIHDIRKRRSFEDVDLKMRVMETKDVLLIAAESLKNVNKKTCKKLESVRNVLVGRDHLFECIVNYVESTDIAEDELSSWYPGLKTCDIFDFFLELIPNITETYKKYFIKSLIVGKDPKRKILEIFRSRMCGSIQCFDVVERDIALFSEFSKKLPHSGRVITSSYWESENEACEDVKRLLPNIKENVPLTHDMYAELSYPLSYAEILIGNKRTVASFVQLNDFMTRNDRSLDFWMKEGVVDESWCSIVYK